MKPGFSVIVCSYNPDERLISRALRSIMDLDTSDIDCEFIMVDNNSSPPLSERVLVKNLPPGKFKMVLEPNPGLANARICGVKHSSFDTIVFVDDDNELRRDYLSGLKKIMSKYPEVGIWGPSKIGVDLIDPTPNWITKYMLEMYQLRNGSETKFGCEKGWPSYYPVGSGIVIKRTVFENYRSLYASGKLTASGRKGESLASGEDSQIIWSAVKNGISAGTTPLLMLTHIIPGKRTTLNYLVELNFNIAYSFYSGQYEIFKDASLLQLKPGMGTYVSLFFKSFKTTNFNLIKAFKVWRVEKAWYRGYQRFYDAIKKSRRI